MSIGSQKENISSIGSIFSGSLVFSTNWNSIFRRHQKMVDWAKHNSANSEQTLVCNHCNCSIPFQRWSCCLKIHEYNDLFHPLGGHLKFHYKKICIGNGRDKAFKDTLEYVNFARMYYSKGRCACGLINFKDQFGTSTLWAFMMMNPNMDEVLYQKKLIDHISQDSKCRSITKSIDFLTKCIEYNEGNCTHCGTHLEYHFDWDTFDRKCRIDRYFLDTIYHHYKSKCNLYTKATRFFKWVRSMIRM